MNRLNGFVFYGEANTTTSEYVTSPQISVGMISSGSSLAPQAICIFIPMLFILKAIWAGLVGLLEFIITRVHEMSFTLGKTWSADGKNENPFIPIDKACTLDERTKKTETAEASDGDEYPLGKRGRRYITLEKIFDRR